MTITTKNLQLAFAFLFPFIATQNNTIFCMNNHPLNIINKHLEKASHYTSGLSQLAAYCNPTARNQLSKTNKLWNGITSKKNGQLLAYMPADLIAPEDQIYLLRYFATNKSQFLLPAISNLLASGVESNPKLKHDILTLSPLECAYLVHNEKPASVLFNACSSDDKNKIDAHFKTKTTRQYKRAILAVYTNNVKALTRNPQWSVALAESTSYTKNAMPAICVAAYLGHIEMLKFLIKHDKQHIIDVSELGVTALYYAAQKGRVHACKLLLPFLSHTINAKGRCGNTTLHYAAFNGSTHIISLLLQYTAQSDKKKLTIDAINHRQWTPLFVATEQQHFQVIQQLVDAGANIHHEDKWKQNLLHILAEQINPNENTRTIAQYFIDKSIYLRKPNEEGCTPLEQAYNNNNQPMIDVLNENLLKNIN